MRYRSLTFLLLVVLLITLTNHTQHLFTISETAISSDVSVQESLSSSSDTVHKSFLILIPNTQTTLQLLINTASNTTPEVILSHLQWNIEGLNSSQGPPKSQNFKI